MNTASECGYTPQYEGLEKLYRRYRERGFVILGFPANDFSGQEPGSNAEIAEFCRLNYGVTFTMLAPQPVKGAAANAVFRELARQTEAPGWNFNKYLVRADGTVVKHLGSRVAPDSAEFTAAVESLLK